MERTKIFNPSGEIKIKVVGDSFAQDAYYSLCESLNRRSVFKFALELVDFDDPLYCDQANLPAVLSGADILIFSNYWQEECYQEAAVLLNKLSESTRVVFVSSSAYPRMKSLSILKSEQNLDFADLESYAYRNQRWDRLKTSQKIENALSEDVETINRSEFFSGIRGDTVNLFDENKHPLIWDNAHLTLRAYDDYGTFLLGKIDPEMSF